MGVIGQVLAVLFGGGRNVLAETAHLFREDAEGAAMREAALRSGALAQFAREFGAPKRGLFDRAMDGVNRLPRPMLALGTLGLFVAAMVDPIWFAARMQGIALVPEPLWWLMGAIVSFYFGARHQTKAREFDLSIARTVGRAGQVTGNLAALKALERGEAGGAVSGVNAALDEWRAKDGAGG